MALTNLTELKSAIADEIHVDDALNTRLEDFIRRAEAKINRRLRLREQEQLLEIDYPVTTTDRFLTLPARFLELLSMASKWAGKPDGYYRNMRFVPPADIVRYYSISRSRPTHFTLRNAIELNTLPDVDYTLRMHYLQGWDLVTDGSNWLLTNFPDVYLYGALYEATAHIQDDKRLIVWKSAFEQALQEAELHAQRSRDDATLSTSELARISHSGYAGYNIYTDEV